MIVNFMIKFIINEEKFYIKYKIERPTYGFKEQLSLDLKVRNKEEYDKAVLKETKRVDEFKKDLKAKYPNYVKQENKCTYWNHAYQKDNGDIDIKRIVSPAEKKAILRDNQLESNMGLSFNNKVLSDGNSDLNDKDCFGFGSQRSFSDNEDEIVNVEKKIIDIEDDLSVKGSELDLSKKYLVKKDKSRFYKRFLKDKIRHRHMEIVEVKDEFLENKNVSMGISPKKGSRRKRDGSLKCFRVCAENHGYHIRMWNHIQ